MIELSVIRDLVAIFGVIAGLTYYTLTVRNANKARQTQIWQSIQQTRGDEKLMLDFATVLHYEWKNWDDWRRKYNWYTNPEEWAKLTYTGHYFDGLGFMLKKGIVDAEDVYDYGGDGITILWYRYREIVEEMRKVDNPRHWQWWEYLVEEMERINDQRGDTLFGLKREKV